MESKNEAEYSSREIKTFVFFDLETNGLIQGRRMPKITEMSMIAVSRSAILDSNGKKLPRVQHKLIVQMCPMQPIPLVVSQLTGLYNDLLENERSFDVGLYETLTHFIDRLAPPLCFVAHNGKNFDYPIFLDALKHIGKGLPNDILCVDSMIGFKLLVGTNKEAEGKNHDAGQINRTGPSNNNESLDFLLDDGFDGALIHTLDLFENFPSVEKDENNPELNYPTVGNLHVNITSPSSLKKVIDHDFKRVGDGATATVTTPKHVGNFPSLQKANETTPLHQIIKTGIEKPYRQTKKGAIVRKRLPFSCNRPINFKLSTVYEYLMGEPPEDAHTAEADCLSMLFCVTQISDSFIDWADRNAVPLITHARAQ